MQSENISKSFDLLLKLYDTIKKDKIDYSALSTQQTRLVGLFTNHRVDNKYKLRKPLSYKKDKGVFNKIFKNNALMLDDDTRSKIVNTINYIKTH